MPEQDRATRAREMIREEVEGLEKAIRERHGDQPEKLHDVHFRQGKIDGLKMAGELLSEGAD